MSSLQKQARSAGVLYGLAGLLAPFALLYVPHALIVPGDATATADRIRASVTLLRLGIVSELFCAVMFVFAVLALYRLLKGVDAGYALAMLVLLLLSIPVSFVGVVNKVAALTLVSGASFLSAFDRGQLDALATFFLRLHGQVHAINVIFWGLWLFPFGVLVMRSGFIPRVLGILLMCAGFAYLATSFTALLFPQHLPVVSRFAIVLQFGEAPILLWLLIWGAREVRTPATFDSIAT